MSPARECAFAVIRRVFEHGAYADRAFQGEARGLGARDRALATRLAYGTVQRRRTLDHVAASLVDRPLGRLQAAVLAGLRLGLYQLLYAPGVAVHAAVAETVELVKPHSLGGAGLLNAVLRRATREGPELLAGLDDCNPAAASIMHSVPEWLAEMWWRELGPDSARGLMAQVNEPAEAALRLNPLAGDPARTAARLPVTFAPAPGLPEGVVLAEPFDVNGSELWREGAIMPQARGSMEVARLLDPQPGEAVLDLAAAPGGKTTHLAALMGDEGRIVAVERHPGRAAALERTCRRMRAGCVRVEVADAAGWSSAERFDRVLVDPPCSGLGTLQSRPDLRWRASPESIPELAELQSAILSTGVAALRPGGRLVYSVCTISAREGPGVLERVLADHPELVVDAASRQLLPHVDRTDGFFLVRLRRRAE